MTEVVFLLHGNLFTWLARSALARSGKRADAMQEATTALTLARDASDSERAENLLARLKRQSDR